MSFWDHTVQLPFWSTGCRAILLLLPSSAAAERVFSLLSNRLEDYISTPVMLQYNSK